MLWGYEKSEKSPLVTKGTGKILDPKCTKRAQYIWMFSSVGAFLLLRLHRIINK